MYIDEKKDGEAHVLEPALDRVAELIRDTATFYENGGGWLQHNYHDNKRAFCILGALRHVEAQKQGTTWCLIPDGVGIVQEAAQRITKTIGYTKNIHYWNDKPGQTKQQVINALKASI